MVSRVLWLERLLNQSEFSIALCDTAFLNEVIADAVVIAERVHDEIFGWVR